MNLSITQHWEKKRNWVKSRQQHPTCALFQPLIQTQSSHCTDDKTRLKQWSQASARIDNVTGSNVHPPPTHISPPRCKPRGACFGLSVTISLTLSHCVLLQDQAVSWGSALSGLGILSESHSTGFLVIGLFPYAQIPHLQICLLDQIYLQPKVNTCIAFIILQGQAQSSEKFESLNVSVPSWGQIRCSLCFPVSIKL
jgi:hypothetical protein